MIPVYDFSHLPDDELLEAIRTIAGRPPERVRKSRHTPEPNIFDTPAKRTGTTHKHWRSPQ